MLNIYWEYAGTRYRSKFRALDAANGNYKEITFYCHESDDFNNYNWSIEPTPSLKELQLQRALQLRDTYPYLKLWFSGGADSTTVLNTFLDNNIHLDEICVYRYAMDNDFDNNLGEYEVNTYTLPYLKKLQHHLPKTKIKIIHNGKDYYDKLLSNDKWFFTKSTMSLRHTYLPKINGTNFCNILGCSDPWVTYDKGKWYHELWDTSEGEYSSLRNIELFFTSADMPDLHAKQCHIVKNYLINEKRFDNNDKYIKEAVIREIVRDPPIAPEPYFFAKTMGRLQSMYLNPKDWYQVKRASKEQKDKIKYLFTQATLKGITMPNVMRNYRAKRLDLGETT